MSQEDGTYIRETIQVYKYHIKGVLINLDYYCWRTIWINLLQVNYREMVWEHDYAIDYGQLLENGLILMTALRMKSNVHQ